MENCRGEIPTPHHSVSIWCQTSLTFHHLFHHTLFFVEYLSNKNISIYKSLFFKVKHAQEVLSNLFVKPDIEKDLYVILYCIVFSSGSQQSVSSVAKIFAWLLTCKLGCDSCNCKKQIHFSIFCARVCMCVKVDSFNLFTFRSENVLEKRKDRSFRFFDFKIEVTPSEKVMLKRSNLAIIF